jgi:hypothetical protein
VGSTSDLRFKENLRVIDNSLEKLLKLRGVQYYWRLVIDGIPTDEIRGDIDLGVIAQEIKEVFPELVNGSEEKGYTVFYNKLIPIIVDAIQQQTKKLELYEIELENLEKIAKNKGLI